MKNLLPLLFVLLTLASCGTLQQAQGDKEVRRSPSKKEADQRADQDEAIASLSKKDLSKNGWKPSDEGLEDPSVDWDHPALPSILGTAKSYLGTRYRYGGTTAEGMDCSGLVCTAFAAQDIPLPRTSADIATLGTELAEEDIAPGDLLFFHTTSRKRITHVGLVVENEDGDIHFIHSSTSSGVIISKLSEPYWQRNFVLAKRVL